MSDKKQRNAVSRLLSALDRLILAAKRAERARDDLLKQNQRHQKDGQKQPGAPA